MEAWLNRIWYGGAAAGWLLLPLSWLFALLSAVRRAGYRAGILESTKLGKPVILVGNLTVGGTGKTPFVVWLVQRLQAAGYKPGVVSRGHGRRDHAPQLVAEDSNAADVGDEPLLIRRRTGRPVAVGRERVLAARLLLTQDVDVLVSDDGLQHYALQRDVEIVTIDGRRGFGNARLLPAGPLREPASRLRDALGIVMVEGHNETSLAGRPVFHMHLAAERIAPLDGDVARSIPLEALRGQRVHAVAGIGHPERFFRTLEGAGLEPVPHPFPDHHVFQAADLEFADDLPVLMTEKDAVKCAGFASSRTGYVPVEARFAETKAQELFALLEERLRAARR